MSYAANGETKIKNLDLPVSRRDHILFYKFFSSCEKYA